MGSLLGLVWKRGRSQTTVPPPNLEQNVEDAEAASFELFKGLPIVRAMEAVSYLARQGHAQTPGAPQ